MSKDDVIFCLNRIISVSTFGDEERNALMEECLEDIVKKISLYMNTQFRLETRLLNTLRLLYSLSLDTLDGIKKGVFPTYMELTEDESIVSNSAIVLDYLEQTEDYFAL